MTVILNKIEREWFSAKVPGTTAQTPLSQLKRKYYISDIGSTSSGTRMEELEKIWLIKYINNKGGTPTAGSSISALWKDAVITLGLTPSNYINENKILFFLNAITESPSLSPSASLSPSSSESASPSA